MKKLILLLAGAALSTGALAQTITTVETIETPSKYPSVAGFVSNGFWDNWELSFGAGASMLKMETFSGDHGSFWHRQGFNANISATKWVHPVFGARLALDGGRYRNYATASSRVNRTPYLFVHTDVMINFSNWAGGYRDDRVYYAVPFAGFGVQITDFTDRTHELGYSTNTEFAFTAGLLNKFRITPAWDINVELKGWIFREKSMGTLSLGGKAAQGYSATLGMSYRFNDRTWAREVPPLYTDAEIAGYVAAIAGLERDLDRSQANESILAEELAAARRALNKRPKESAPTFIGGSYAVFFAINSAELTQQTQITLDMVAEQIKAAPAGDRFDISGYADKETGSEAYNLELSQRRAEAVAKYLEGKGIAADRLTVKGFGAAVQPFTGNIDNNRVVVVK